MINRKSTNNVCTRENSTNKFLTITFKFQILINQFRRFFVCLERRKDFLNRLSCPTRIFLSKVTTYYSLFLEHVGLRKGYCTKIAGFLSIYSLSPTIGGFASVTTCDVTDQLGNFSISSSQVQLHVRVRKTLKCNKKELQIRPWPWSFEEREDFLKTHPSLDEKPVRYDPSHMILSHISK